MRLTLLLLVCLSGCWAADYTGHRVLSVYPNTPEHVQWLRDLESEPMGATLDFWTEPRAVGIPVDIQVDPLHIDMIQKVLEEQQIPFATKIVDVQSALDTHLGEVHAHRAAAQRSSIIYNFDRYLDQSEVDAYLIGKQNECGALRCELLSIGLSWQGRQLEILKITNGDSVTKPGLWIDAGIHPREWIALPVAMYFIERLIEDYGNDLDVTRTLNNYDVYVMPSVNPDGYVYSWGPDRLWRKTRSTHPNPSGCVGTDIDRNFNFHWMTVGASSNPCQANYAGPAPTSELETQALNDFIMARVGNWKLRLSLHSYAQLVVTPFGYTSVFPADWDELMRVANVTRDALFTVHQTVYQTGAAFQIGYESSGTSLDWARGVANIPYDYDLLLRDRGTYGFMLPEVEINPSCVETWAGFKAMMAAIGYN